MSAGRTRTGADRTRTGAGRTRVRWCSEKIQDFPLMGTLHFMKTYIAILILNYVAIS